MRPAIIIGFLVLGNVASDQALGEIPAIKEYSGGHLTVEPPYDTILADELLHVRLSIENAGAEPITIITAGMNDLVQLVWIPWKDGAPEERRGRIPGIGTFRRSPLELVGDHNLAIYESEELMPGGKRTVERVHASSLGGVIPSDLGTFQLRPALYVGGGRVVYGSPVTLTALQERVKDFPIVFESTWQTGRGSIPIRIHEVQIQGETYLFHHSGARFCRIPPGVGYRIGSEQKSQIERFTTVVFDRPDLKPLVFSWAKYALVSASRETVPWLFDKPEEEESASSDMEGDPAPTAATKTVPSSRVEPSATMGAGWWPWVVAAGVLLALGWIVRKNAA